MNQSNQLIDRLSNMWLKVWYSFLFPVLKTNMFILHQQRGNAMRALQFYKKKQRFFSAEHALHCSVCFPLVLRFWVVPFSLFFCSRSSRRYDTAPTNFYSLNGDDDSLCFLIVCLEKETRPALEILPLKCNKPG